MNFENENKLLKIIKFIPSIFLIAIALISLSFLYIENIRDFNNQKNEIQENYILKSKELIKERVNNTYNYIIDMQKSTEEKLKQSLKEEMHKAYAIANSIYENNKNIHDEETIKKLIKDAIRPIRFNNGRGYFFIHDKNVFSNTMHPIMPKLEGKNSYNVKDANGNYIIRQMHKELKNKDETVFEWYWYKPGNKKTQFKKIGYIKNFKPFNWFIGTGEYVKDFEKEVQKDVLERISSTKFNENGYIFVVTYEGKILNYFKKHLINRNINEFDKTKKDMQKGIDIAKEKKESFLEYSSIPNPLNNIPTKKTSYLKNVEKWNWVIGTGFYEDDINKVINEKKKELDNNIFQHMKKTIIISVILALILFILSVYLSKIINKKFLSYKKEIDIHIKEKSKQQHILSQQAKMAAMGEMIGNIAHQWRQPLSNISTLSTSMIVQKELSLLDDDSLKEGLTKINNKAQYLSQTIDDFRDFFNSNKNRTTFNIVTSINDALSIVGSSFKNNEIEIIKKLEDIKILTYKNELIQVIINILNNAKDALTSKDKDKLIFIQIKKEEKNLILSIKDTAGGIDEKIIDKIFEPYFTTKHQAQGTGIGLYMSSEIITKHLKGSIKVSNITFEYKNKEFKGACFEIIIPINVKDEV